VGNEILDGITLDTNSQWIINRLKPLGLQVHEAITARDNVEAIGEAINRLIDDGCSLIFTTGGLGPTHDDMTLLGIAHGLGLPLEQDQASLDIVTRQYKVLHKRGIIESGEITDSRRKMAILPRGSRPLDNRVGGAPGVLLEARGSTIICLPGVPLELKWIFDDQVTPILKSIVREVYAEKIVALPLRDESTLAPIIDQVMAEEPGVYVKSLVKPYGEEGIRLWVSSLGKNRGDPTPYIHDSSQVFRELSHVNVTELDVPTQVKRILAERGLDELYPPQADAIETGVLDGRNLVLASPTASGKTLIAELCALKHILERQGKVLYLTPLRALTWEKYEEFQAYTDLVKPNGRKIRVGVSTGDMDNSSPWLEAYDIVICTNEKCETRSATASSATAAHG